MARSERLKRGIDVVLALLLLIVVLPVLTATAVAILVADGRPFLFRQWRVGRDGVPFKMYKFRTMVRDAEQRLHECSLANERNGPLFKVTRDPRVTSLGRLLRWSSLDELPQLFNVLGGTMSLVGPRPALPKEVEYFSAEFRTLRHQVKPGITGLWQVQARDEPSFEAYERFDAFYAQNRTIGMDLAILARTAPAVLRTGRRRVSAKRARTDRA